MVTNGAYADHFGALPDHLGALPDHFGALSDHLGALPDHFGALPVARGRKNRQKLQEVDQQLANVAKVAPEEHWDEMSPLNRDNMSPGT